MIAVSEAFGKRGQAENAEQIKARRICAPQAEKAGNDIIETMHGGGYRNARTRRQIGDGVDFPSLRVKAALARLTESKRLKHVSGSGLTTTYDLVGGEA